MVKRILLGGILGGIAMFVCGSIIHMATPLGMAGIRPLPATETIIPVLRDNLTEHSAYMFPTFDWRAKLSDAEQEAAQEKMIKDYREGPSGILFYEPQGRELKMPELLCKELLSNITCALLAALLLTPAAPTLGYLGRVFFVAALGLFGALAIEVSYWNWYNFPAAYTMAQVIGQTLEAAAGGLVIAAFVKRPA